MKTIIATLQLLVIAFLLCSCSTTYHAPDAKKLNASATRLKKAIVKSHDTAAKAKKKHEEVIASSEAVFASSEDLDERINELMKNAPPELQPQIKEIQDTRHANQVYEDDLRAKIEQERVIHEQLAKDNQEVTAAKTDWDRESSNYQNAAAIVATTATEDNKKLSSQLWKQKLLSALGITGAIVFVVSLVGGFILWKLGKLAIKF